jgi:signal transduction histidine kinase
VRRRLAIVLMATTGLVVVSLLIPLGLAVRTIPRDRALNRARLLSLSVAQAMGVVPDPTRLKALVTQTSDLNEGGVSVLMSDGTQVGTPFMVDPTTTEAINGTSLELKTQHGVQLLTPVVNSTGISVVGVFVPDDVMTRGVYGAWLVLGALGLLMIGVAVGVADRLARAITTPIVALATTTKSLAQGNLSARVRPSGPAEVRDVGLTLNLLADRIGELLVSEREAIADLSHRLRTPITVLRLDAESLSDRSEAMRLTEDVDLLTKAVDELIRRARLPMDDEEICDLRATAIERVEFWRPLLEEQHRPLNWVPPAGKLWVPVNTDELQAVFDVLVDNVVSHSPEGCAVSITVAGDSRNVHLRIDDAGPGFGEEELIRGSSGTGSTGIGLSIVTKTAAKAGGTVSVRRSPLGGACVEVVLPLLFIESLARRPISEQHRPTQNRP